MRKAKVGLKVINLNMSNREPISLQAVYEKEKYDEKGNLLNERDEFMQEFFFREVTVDELMKLRLGRKPGAVYKIGGKFYYTEIPGHLKIIRLSEAAGPHLCGKDCTNVCKDCTRTSDLTAAFQERMGRKFPYTILESWRIEKYDYITEGLEAFNMSNQNDAFMVLDCQNYKVSGPRLLTVNKSVADLKVGLANFYWDDFHGTLQDMRRRINSQKTG